MAEKKSKRVPATFYRSAAGTEPVRAWLKRLSDVDRRSIGTDVATVEFGWPVGMPVCRPLGQGLYEIRSNLQDERVARVLFCFADGKMVLLHGFVKKTRKTPGSDLDLAMKRKKEVER